MADFLLLGALQWSVGGRPVDLGRPKQRIVLATLLAAAGHPVPLDTLIENVWDENRPRGARNVVYAHITRIRRTFAGVAGGGTGGPPHLARRGSGYAVEVDPQRVDLHVVRGLIDRARVAESDRQRAAHMYRIGIRAADAMWTIPVARG